MSQRHYIYVMNNSSKKELYCSQILGNNDFFDETFYENMNIKVEDDGWFDLTKITYRDFLYEWHNWLNRHPEKKGFNQIPEHIKERFKNNTDLLKEYLVLHYATTQSYEQQIHEITKNIMNYLDVKGKEKDSIEIYLECY